MIKVKWRAKIITWFEGNDVQSIFKAKNLSVIVKLNALGSLKVIIRALLVVRSIKNFKEP